MLISRGPSFVSSNICSQSHPFAVAHRAAGLHTAAVLRSALPTQAEKPGSHPTKEDATRPSVILGTRPHEEEFRWSDCALAQCLVNPHNLNGPPPSTVDERVDVHDFATVTIPKDTNYGIGPVEKQMLFHELPRLSSQAPFYREKSRFTSVFDSQLHSPTDAEIKEKDTRTTAKELAKIDAFSKVIDLRNANAKGIAYENRRRIILEFSGPKNPFDPGRAEVQAAILTYEIRNLWNHLTTFKRDVGNRRGLGKLVHQRAKILKYLKKKNRDRYEALLPRLAIDPTAVEGELVV